MSDQNQSRSEKRSKRRKTNRILNTAIVVVIVLIVIVAYSIFSGGNDEEEAKGTNITQQTESPKDKSPNKKQAESKDHHDDEDQDDKKKKKEEVIEEEGDEPNVDKNIKDPSWEPIGTEQTGTHSSSFDMGSVDWNEKVQALSYATGISEDNMTVWFIKGAGPDKAIGTVSPKDSQNDAYRVHIKWVDGEGWKPTKVQKLIENDKGR